MGDTMNGNQMPGEMTPYDRKAWDQIEGWREKRLTARTRRALPEGARERLRDVGQKVRTRVETVPGLPDFESIFLKSLEALVGLGGRAAVATVPKKTVVKAYRKHDADVEELEDIRKIDLALIDKVKPRLGLRYTAFAGAEGAGAGFAASGGGLLAAGGTVAGAGAGAAPGAALVIGTLVADSAAVLLAGQRAIAHIGAYYGYDPEHPDEQLFMLGILNLGTASEGGKVVAYAEINKLVQALARNATWEQLNQNVVTKVVEKVFTRLGFRLTKAKLGQAVPVMGIAIGAGMNTRFLKRITDDAEHMYRERFLRDRYGIEVEPDSVAADADSHEDVDIVDIVDAEIVDEDNERERHEAPAGPEGGERG
ncbi:EcsC family protein [Spirillospora sp. NPDC048819]|uniref:EcsC family protein n=1 Tax=Spirillospora sp. NPDC048819 TaxID=3155268 RepID=UPI0033E2B3A2